MVEYSIMKKWKLFISYLIFTGLLFAACATKSTDAVNEVQESLPEEALLIIPEPSAEELFLSSLENIQIKFTKAPAKTKKGKAFAGEFELLVTDKEELPVKDFELTLEIPLIKEGTNLIYSKINIKTGNDGLVAYAPQAPDFAANTKITARPAIPQGLNIDEVLMTPYSVSADFVSESDIAAKGAILFVFEYNENGKSPKNSYDILSGLRKKGVTMIGNAPISDTEYITASKSKIYKDNYEYVGTDFGYLIGGTFKFKNPVEKNEDGTYTASMIADIYGIDMKNGNVIYENTIEYKSSGSNWNKAVDSCKTNLTAMVVDSIMFGL